MRNKVIFVMVIIGVLGALFSAYVYAVPNKPQAPSSCRGSAMFS